MTRAQEAWIPRQVPIWIIGEASERGLERSEKHHTPLNHTRRQIRQQCRPVLGRVEGTVGDHGVDTGAKPRRDQRSVYGMGSLPCTRRWLIPRGPHLEDIIEIDYGNRASDTS